MNPDQIYRYKYIYISFIKFLLCFFSLRVCSGRPGQKGGSGVQNCCRHRRRPLANLVRFSFMPGGFKEMSSILGGNCGVLFQPMNTAMGVHRSPNKHMRSNSIFYLWFMRNDFSCRYYSTVDNAGSYLFDLSLCDTVVTRVDFPLHKSGRCAPPLLPEHLYKIAFLNSAKIQKFVIGKSANQCKNASVKDRLTYMEARRINLLL